MKDTDANMPTQRPFLSNFIAAFRAHNAIQQSKGPSPSSQQSHTSHTTSSTPQPSNPRTITTSTKPGATTAALSTLHSPRTHSASPLSTSPGTHTPPSSPGADQQRGRYIASQRGRRGSDSSSEGFRDVLGAEKWYIGGRTAAGEEKYFKLGVVRRRRSNGSLSLDRLSL